MRQTERDRVWNALNDDERAMVTAAVELQNQATLAAGSAKRRAAPAIAALGCLGCGGLLLFLLVVPSFTDAMAKAKARRGGTSTTAPATTASPDLPPKGLTRVGGQGQVDFVVAARDLAKNASLLESQMRAFCDVRHRGADFCQIMAWSDSRKVPKALPMTDAQVETQLAQYNRNTNTGHDCFALMKDGDITRQTGNCN